jgi:hypothetical protein
MSLWYPPEGWQDMPSPFADIDLEELEGFLADYVDLPPVGHEVQYDPFSTPVTMETLWAMSD